MKLSEEIMHFFQNQGFVVIATIDKNGYPHISCKGIVDIKNNGRVYLLDVYCARTYENLLHNHYVSISAINEHKFTGYCLKGKGRIMPPEELRPEIIKAWEDRITSRLTQRLLKNIRDEKGHSRHPEAMLPKPEYLLEVEVEEAVNLTPPPLK
ncbi:MAG: pyridoxamine 5'-phosphate oxidase family protein [Candidatus Omnitrophota bacterium]|jgi:predicted pyridoxine 5'-phosphate oxidase superfamily flavin-nucleotide-binding protein